MKRSRYTKRIHKALCKHSNNIVLAMFLFGLSVALLYKKPVQAASRRGKTAAAVIVGAGAGGTIAGIAGSAKWAPLGIVGGGIFAGLLARRILKNRAAERENRTHYSKRYTRRYKNRRRHMDQESDVVQDMPTRSMSYKNQYDPKQMR